MKQLKFGVFLFLCVAISNVIIAQNIGEAEESKDVPNPTYNGFDFELLWNNGEWNSYNLISGAYEPKSFKMLYRHNQSYFDNAVTYFQFQLYLEPSGEYIQGTSTVGHSSSELTSDFIVESPVFSNVDLREAESVKGYVYIYLEVSS